MMFTQIYYHPIRQVYDLHLQDFLSAWLDGGRFGTELPRHLQMTDNEVTAAMADAARTPAAAGHDPARRIIGREHFKILYEATPGDLDITLEPGQAVAAAAGEEFGPGNIKHTQRAVKSGAVNFPVLLRDGTVASSLALSSLLGSLPSGASDFVFVAPDRHDEAKRWLDRNRHDILSQTT